MKKKNLKSVLISIAIIAVVLLLAVALYLWKRQTKSTPPLTLSQNEQTSATPTSAQIQPVAEPSPTVPLVSSPTPSVTTSPSSSTNSSSPLPSSAQALLKNFYAAYAAKDRVQLGGFFSPDSTSGDLSLHSRLFKGVDLQGNPGGPTLFSSNSASQVAVSYSILTSLSKGSGWQETINEQRVGADGKSIGNLTTIITLVPSGNSWLIDSYTRTSGSGKYSAFLLP